MRSVFVVALGSASAAALLTAAVASCGDDTITLATIDVSDAGQVEGPCAADDACAPGEFCDRESCSTSLLGTCRVPDLTCEAVAPVCGCDGVTYFNDCLRQEKHVALSYKKPCSPRTAASCGGPPGAPPNGCKMGEICSALFQGDPSACPPDVHPTCWRLPPQCPLNSGVSRWSPCSGIGPVCLDACQALLQTASGGGPYHSVDQCPDAAPP
jgi:hypothetical protein